MDRRVVWIFVGVGMTVGGFVPELWGGSALGLASLVFGSLIGAIVEAGRSEPTLRPDSLAALEELDRDLALDVFVTPT